MKTLEGLIEDKEYIKILYEIERFGISQELINDLEAFIKKVYEAGGEAEREKYGEILHEVSIVYEHLTGGLLSYPDYKAGVIISHVENLNYDKYCTKEDVRDMLKDTDNFDQLKQELIEYFELKEESK
jgi:hypothetical protein